MSFSTWDERRVVSNVCEADNNQDPTPLPSSFPLRHVSVEFVNRKAWVLSPRHLFQVSGNPEDCVRQADVLDVIFNDLIPRAPCMYEIKVNMIALLLPTSYILTVQPHVSTTPCLHFTLLTANLSRQALL